MTSTGFIYGLTNVAESAALGTYPAPDPTLFHTWFDDFDQYTSADWVITTVGTSTIQVQDEINGILGVTTDANDNDHSYFQWAGNTSTTVVETWRPTSGKALYFKARFKISEVIQSDFFAGLYVVDTDPVGGIVNGMYFTKTDGSAVLNFVTVAGSTATTTAVATLVADTYVSVAFVYDGYSGLNLFVDGNRVASSAVANIPATELALSFAIQAGEAILGGKKLSLDYLFVSEER